MNAFVPTGADVYHLSEWLSAVGIVALVFLAFYGVLEAFGNYFAKHHP